MRLRHFAQTCAAGGALALAVALAAPALAHDDARQGSDIAAPGAGEQPMWKDGQASPSSSPAQNADAQDPVQAGAQAAAQDMTARAREEWLVDCRRRLSDNGVGGAVIGGLAGGVIGNRVAGHGNRTVGTVAGAAVGAVAGAAIDKAEDRGRVRDECQTYMDNYYAQYHRGYYGQYTGSNVQGSPANGSGAPIMAGPMIAVQQPQQPCTETVVTEEYVTVPTGRRARRLPARHAPDKRIRIK